VGLGIRLLQQREPGLVGVLALGKEQGTAGGLVDLAVLLLRVGPLNVLPQGAFPVQRPAGDELVVVGLDEVELHQPVSAVHAASILQIPEGVKHTLSSIISLIHSPSR